MPDETTLQLGAMGIILLFTIRELFAYLKAREQVKSAPEASATFSKEILSELQILNNNHLHTLQDSLHSDNVKIIELLGEIKGSLQSRR